MAPLNCSSKNIGGANMRFRLEPTLNVTDQVRVHAQIDVLDNTIMGSTPDSLAGIEGFNRPIMTGTNADTPGNAPSPFLSTSQDPPEVGQNGFLSSIRAKRAWAEVDTEFGSIRFGRMPWHWGRGIFYNQGSCADCDVGTTVDRVMGLTTIYGHQIALAWDLGAQGPTTQQLSLGRSDPTGYPYDLSQNDDVLQLMGAITRIDNPVTLRERIDRGDIVANYGLQVVYRNQGYMVAPTQTPMTSTQQNQNGPPTADAQRGRSRWFLELPRRLVGHARPLVQAELQGADAGVRGHRHLRQDQSPGHAGGGRLDADDATPDRVGAGQRAAPVSRIPVRGAGDRRRDG
jgi:uncharacterized protein (TIGR04551 family)